MNTKISVLVIWVEAITYLFHIMCMTVPLGDIIVSIPLIWLLIIVSILLIWLLHYPFNTFDLVVTLLFQYF